MSRRSKLLVIALGCLAIYFVAVYFGLSTVLTRMVPGKLAELSGRTVTIDQIRVNPLTLSVTVSGFELKDKNTTDSFVRFETLYVNVEILSLIKRGLILSALRLEQPTIHVTRLSDTSFNFSDLIKNQPGDEQAEPDAPAETARPFYFAVADISITDGAIIYRDEPVGETHTITPINWRLPLISNFSKQQDRFSEPALTCTVDGASLSVDVRTKPFKDSKETVVDLALSGLSIPRYTGYIPADLIGFKVAKGVLDLNAQVSFRKEGDAPVVSAQGKMVLADLDVTDKEGIDMVILPRLELALLPSVITENSVHLGDVRVQSPVLSAVRLGDGTINLTTMIPPTGKDTQAETMEENTAPAKTFRLDVDRFVLDTGTVRFTDFAVGDQEDSGKKNPVESTINDLAVTVTGFSTATDKPSQFELSANINATAPLTVNGHMALAPLSLDSDITLSDVALAWGQAYLPDNVALVITGGLASTSGHVSLAMDDKNQLSTTITGKAAVREFASVDPEKAESFLRWDDFSIDGVKVSVQPLRVSVDTIAFTNLNNQLVVFEDGTSSMEKIFPKKEETEASKDATASPAPSSSVTPIRIGAFKMTNTQFKFMDRSVAPHYSTRLALKKLSVTGLTSEDFKAADVAATGAIDGYAPVTVTGTINPLAKDLFVNLDVKLANMEMVPFSTYTGKFIGRAVEKGKLNIDVQYNIKDKEIKAGNHISMDQFTLGKTVESPDALNLPVGLALSLLTDRNGMIDINLPISGRTDDPNFAWGKVVLKALGNLITKAATSPFALVGSLVGGGEELRFIEFEPGVAQLDEVGRQKLGAIQTLLTERPALNMEIVGYADADADRRALAELSLDRMIKAPALVAAAKQGQAPDAATLAAIVLTPEQRMKALRKLYKKEVIAKPQDDQPVKPANDPTLTPDEMETALLNRMVITDADLQLLAAERAGQVKETLLQDQAISADRVFLKESDSPIKQASDAFKPSRVELGVQ